MKINSWQHMPSSSIMSMYLVAMHHTKSLCPYGHEEITQSKLHSVSGKVVTGALLEWANTLKLSLFAQNKFAIWKHNDTSSITQV
jgi:hypothetical protein